MTPAGAVHGVQPRETWLAALLLIGATVAAYANTFAVPFLFDDLFSIRDNVTIRQWSTGLSPPAGGGLTVSGRPLLNFTLAINYALSGTAVWSYHLVNLMVHTLAGLVLFGVVRRTLTRPALEKHFGLDAKWLALAIALIWTLHPLQTEAVTYIVQRAESLSGLMYLLTLWCFIRSVEPGAARIWAPLAFVACLLGMAAKEVMVTAPVMVLLYDRIFVAGSWRQVWSHRGRFHLALMATWLPLAWLVLGTSNRGGTAGLGGEMSPWAYGLTQIGAVVHYLRLAVWPSPLVFDYGTPLARGWGDVWWQALLLVPLAAASAWAVLRGRPAGYAGAFFLIVLTPSSSFVPVVTQTMNEHRVYLSLAALVALLAAGLYQLWGRKSLMVLAALAVVMGVLTVRRNHDYRSEIALWEDTVAKRPDNARALAALGNAYKDVGRLDEALTLLQESVRLAPLLAPMHNNLGNVWMKLGRWEEARQCFAQALMLHAGDPTVLNNLGNALLQLGRVPEALAQFEAALRVDSKLIEPRYNLANTLAQSGRARDASVHYAILLQIRPDDPEARSNYANVLQELDRLPEAMVQLQEAVRLRPASAELHNNLGVALAQAGQPAKALEEFREAVRLDPSFQQAQQNAARASQALGTARDR